MKRILILFMIMIVFSGQAYSKTDYEKYTNGYNVGYAAGLDDGENEKTFNSVTNGNSNYKEGYAYGYEKGYYEAIPESTTTESTASESTESESTTTESTVTESTESESTTTESTATESTESESTTTESTASESTESESTATETESTTSENVTKVYLIVPNSATDLSYYARNKNGKVTITEDEDSTVSKYFGNNDLNLVTLTSYSDDVFKIMARYKMDDKYYFLISPDAVVDDIKDDFDSDDTLSEVYSTFGDYDSYPGIKIKDGIRLSMIPVTAGTKNLTEVTEEVTVKGETGINPNSSDDKEFSMILKDGTEYGLKKNSGKYNLWSLTKDEEADTLSFDEITYLNFTSKEVSSIAEGDLLKEDGVSIENNKTYTYEGDMKATFTQENDGNGKWFMEIDGTTGGGETIVLLEDTGTVASSGIDVDSKVKSKSRKRDTRLETSIIDSENFVIENIKE